MRSTSAVVALILLAGCAAEPDQFAVSGRILGADGSPTIQSDIQLFSNEPIRPRTVLRTFRVDRDGRYSIPVASPGFYFLRVCGVNHQPVEMPLYLHRVRNVALDIKLNAIEYVDDPEAVTLIGDFNGFSQRGGGLPMTRGADGVYRAEVEARADTLAYQILGIDKNGHSVNGTQADYWVPDVSGDYTSVVETRGKPTITIELDMNGLNRAPGGGSIVFGKENSYEETFARIYTDVVNRRNEMWSAYAEHARRGGDPDNFSYDSRRDTDVLDKLWEKERDPVLRDMRMWARVAYGKLDSTLSARVLDRLEPDSPAWSIDPQLLTNLMISTGEDSLYLDYLISLVDRHPDETIKPFILQHAMWVADNHGMDGLLRQLYERFVADYPTSSSLESVNASYSPDRDIQPGKPVPDFRFESLDDPLKILDRKSLLGKVYLIDFWATWCGPCVAEMEYIHEAYEDFGKEGLVVVSVSFDWQVENVRKFRSEKWPMPWFNAFETYSESSPVVRDFELVSIPKPVLVGADGLIIAAAGKLRGQKLHKTLSDVFGD